MKTIIENAVKKYGSLVDSKSVSLKDEFPIDVEATTMEGVKIPNALKRYEPIEFRQLPLKEKKVKVGISLESFKDVVGKDALRPITTGVKRDGDVLVGTDCHGLVTYTDHKSVLPEGMVLDLSEYIKTKGLVMRGIEGRYPDWRNVIPSEGDSLGELDLKRIEAVCEAFKLVRHNTGVDLCAVKLGGVWFNPVILGKVVGFIRKCGYDTATGMIYNKTLRLDYGGDVGLVMGIYTEGNLDSFNRYEL